MGNFTLSPVRTTTPGQGFEGVLRSIFVGSTIKDFPITLVGLDCCGPFRTGLEGIVGLGLTWPSGTRTSRQPKIQAARSKIHPTS